MKKILFILCILPILGNSQVLDFKATPTKRNIVIGEPAEINLTLKTGANQIFDTVYFKLSELGDSLGNNWELWDKSTLKKSSDQDNEGNYYITFSQKITIANFDTGQFVFPAAIAYADTTKTYSNSLLFTVNLENIDEKAFIKDIKPIKKVSISWLEYLFYFINHYKWWILSIIVLIAAIVIAYKKLINKKEIKKLESSIPLEIILLEELSKIEKQKYWENNYFKKYYSELSNILWQFLEYRYQIKTFEKTSAEILESLKWSSIPKEYLPPIERFFQISDSVKFAKQHALEKDNIAAYDNIKTLIEQQRLDIIKENSESIE